MFFIKSKSLVFACVTLFSCTCNLWSMKALFEIEEINNHGIEITKPQDETKAFVIPESMKVNHVPLLQEKTNIIPLNTKNVAYYNGNSTVIVDIIDGKECSSFDTWWPLAKLTDDTIALRNKTGDFALVNFENFKIQIFKNSIAVVTYKVVAVQKITETTVVSINKNGIMDIWDMQKNCLLGNIQGTPCSPSMVARISKSKIITIDKGKDGFTCWDVENKSSKTIKLKHSPNSPFRWLNITAISKRCFALMRSAHTVGREPYFESSLDEFYNLPSGFREVVKIDVSVKILDANIFRTIQDIKVASEEALGFYCDETCFLLSSQTNNMLVAYQKVLENKEKDVVLFWQLQPSPILVQKLILTSFLKKNNDEVISISYFEKENTIMIITQKRFVITLRCKEKNTKSEKFFFQNLNTAPKKKNFRDIGFIFEK